MRSAPAPTASCSTRVSKASGQRAYYCTCVFSLESVTTHDQCVLLNLYTEQLISGKEDAANNFARGHYTIGKVHKLKAYITA
jgi:hypothetical protein